jgi:hypothetical protein
MSNPVELAIVIPCLNEAETLPACIAKARRGLQAAGVAGEILVADNGSTDGSAAVAEQAGARVVSIREKGYGSALRGGIEAAQARWIIMGDADDSYDFSRIDGMVQKLRDGFDLVMGCRFPSGGGTIVPGAMPWKNRWIGNPLLSFIGRFFFKCPVRDFFCGLRGFSRAAYDQMELKTTGMEFAFEMVIKATMIKSLKIAEVPITLWPDGRSRFPHLKPWRDGWRTLRFMLIYSPRWLFLTPGLVLVFTGGVGGMVLSVSVVHLGNVRFDVGSLAVANMAAVVGLQLVAFAFYTKVFAIAEGLLPQDPQFAKIFRFFTLEKGIAVGVLFLLVGGGLLVHAVAVWKSAHYGDLDYSENLRRLLPAVTLIMTGIQIVFSSFFMSILGLKTSSRQPPANPI